MRKAQHSGCRAFLSGVISPGCFCVQLLVRCLAGCTEVAEWMFGAADDCAVVVVMAEVKVGAGQYRLQASPAANFACGYHADPYLAFG